MIPLEFAMGRLINNANIILCILIPTLRYQYNMQQDKPGEIRINGISGVIALSICIASLVLVNQLSHQDGYTPYLNYLRGDEPVIFKVEEDEEEWTSSTQQTENVENADESAESNENETENYSKRHK